MRFLKQACSCVFFRSFLFFLSTTLFVAQGQEPKALDPLSGSEKNILAELSRSIIAVGMDPLHTPSDQPVLAGQGRVTLLTERRLNGKNQHQERLADVYIYDYDLNELLHLIVDLPRQRVIKQTSFRGTQLPLVEEEIDRVIQIIYEDDEYRGLIDAEFQRITGRRLDGIADLQYKAFVFHIDTLPLGANLSTQKCGLHRCAQVLLYSADNIVIDVSPIVDLSLGIVTQNTGASLVGHNHNQHSHTAE